MNRLLIFVCSLLLWSSAYGQVKEGERSMSQGTKNSLTLILKDTKAKLAEESWTRFIKDYKGKTKMNKKTGEIFSDNCNMPGVSSNTVDVYTKINQMGADAEVVIWFDLGGAYLSEVKHPGGFAEANVIIEKYNLTIFKLALEEEIENQESVIKKMQGDLGDMKKDQKDFEEEITKCEKKIEEAKASLQENSGLQVAKMTEIKMQEEKLKEVKDKLKGM